MWGGQGAVELTEDRLVQLDSALNRALLTVEQVADVIQMTGSSDNAPAAWKSWFFWEGIGEIAPFAHPERDYRRNIAKARESAISTFQRSAIDYDLSSDSEYATVNPQNIRYYVMSHIAKMKDAPPFPDVKSIDAAMLEQFNKLWNTSGWVVRRKQVRMKIDVFSVSDATWTAATKTLTKSSEMGNAAAGSVALVTAGTNALKREFTIASKTANTVVFDADIGADDAAADIDVTIATISFENLASTESYDSTGSVRWLYTDVIGTRSQLRYTDADNFQEYKSEDETTTGRPQYYRTNRLGTRVTWQFTPFPDTDYFLVGEVFLARPSDASSATDTAPFDRLFSESLPWVKRATLDQVLTNHGMHDLNLHAQVQEEYELFFPAYQDPGRANRDVGIADVNRDTEHLRGGVEGYIGGPM
jgi:hypothetical protein